MRCMSCLLALTITVSARGADSKEPITIADPSAFKTLVNPNCSHCRDEAKRRASELRDNDRVLCWIRGYSDGGAIPERFFLNTYRVISDSYGVFVFDADAGFARGYTPSYDFSFHGWRNGVMVMKHKDGTLYSCLTGVAFDGPNKGKKLETIPTLVSDWGFWLKRYPGAVAYHMFDKYQPVELPAGENAASHKTRPQPDSRLSSDTLVLGVTTGNEARAYPLDALAKAGIITDTLAGKPCIVLWYGPTKTASAYSSVATPPTKDSAPNRDLKPAPKKDLPTRTVTLTRAASGGPAPFIDKETGSHWDIAGRAVDGQLKGWKLHWIDSTQVKWFAWAAEYPGTRIHGGVGRGAPN